MTVIRKIFGNGQITLPKKWRDNFATSVVQMSIGPDGVVTIKPVEVEEEKYETIFDSKDFDYKDGVSAEDFLKTLKKIWKTDNISLNDLDQEDQELITSGRKAYKKKQLNNFEAIDDFFA